MTLYELVAATADRYPDLPALEVDGQCFSYRELVTCAANVAARLGTPDRVGILAARSPIAYVGYLAALRLGAAVVPMDPASPPLRNASVATLASLDVTITDRPASDLPVATIDLSAVDWRSRVSAPVRDRGPDSLAYIMFTSGSTGRPKGVPLRHRNVLPNIAYNIARYDVAPGSRWGQTGELVFDQSVQVMFVAWGAGATLVVPTRDELFSPVRFIGNRRITHWHSVPSVISIARRLRSLGSGAMPGLRWTLFGGEQLTIDQARAWHEAAPNSRVENVYGPTELTIGCTAYRLPDSEPRWPDTSNGTVPIGTVYPHLQALVLDPDGRPAEEGELCVRGAQRFDGYLDPADDIGRFVAYDGLRASPCTGPVTEEHFYRTGDRVRYELGQLVHCGRLDDQVKIRGHRIEPGEIEAVLRNHPAVQEVAVVPVAAADGETDLIAWYTGTPAGDGELAAPVLAALPAYALPRRFHQVERLPLTSNGKLDRRSLIEMSLTGRT